MRRHEIIHVGLSCLHIQKKTLKQNQNDKSINMQQEHPEENHWMVSGNRSNKTVINQQLTSTDLLVWIIVD